MENGNIKEPHLGPADTCGETCESCEAPAMDNCQSCGMPMTGPENYGGGNTDNNYCIHCCHPDGSLKSYEDVLQGMTGLMMNMRGLDRAAAGSAAREYLAMMPAWNNR